MTDEAKKLPQGFTTEVITALVQAGKCHGVITEPREDGLYVLRWQDRDGEILIASDADIAAAIDEVAIKAIRRLRAAAMRDEADPLYFKAQAGEGSEADWIAKRAEIRARYPYPVQS